MKMNNGFPTTMMFVAALATSAYACDAEHTPAAKPEEAEVDRNNNNGTGRQEEGANNSAGLNNASGYYDPCDEEVDADILRFHTDITATVDACYEQLDGDQQTGVGNFAPISVDVAPTENTVEFSRFGIAASGPEFFNGERNVSTGTEISPQGGSIQTFTANDGLTEFVSYHQIAYIGDKIQALQAGISPDGSINTEVVCVLYDHTYTGYIITFDKDGEVLSICEDQVADKNYYDLRDRVAGDVEDQHLRMGVGQ